MTTQFSGFERFYIDSIATDGTQTLTEITEYVKSAKIPTNAKTFDGSTFAAYGAQSANRQRRGALSVSATLEVFVNATTWKIFCQLRGRRNVAATFTATLGVNASPTTNDPKVTFEAGLFKMSLPHETDKELTMTWELKPLDTQTAVVPQYTRV